MFRDVLLTLLSLFFLPCLGFANTQPPQPIVLQLKWDPEFQFAGFYAALWQGYYLEVGLDVKIVSRLTDNGQLLNVADEVESGRAQFGVGGPDILLHQDKGRAFMVVGTLFQKSPHAYFALQDGPIKTLEDFSNARIATSRDFGLTELLVLTKHQGIQLQMDKWVEYEFGLAPLARGTADVVLDYAVSGHWAASRKKLKVKEFSSKDYGLNFYGDLVFTMESYAQENPLLVSQFWDATVHGWQHALSNEVDIARRLAALPRVFAYEDPLSYNLHESRIVRKLMNYPETPIGHTNKKRWGEIHQHLKDMDFVKNEFDFNRFYFDYQRYLKNNQEQKKSIILVFIFILSFIILLFLLYRYVKYQRTRRKHFQQVVENESRLSYAFEAANQGVWEIDANSVLYLSAGAYQVLGYGPKGFEATLSALFYKVHPDDLAIIEKFFYDCGQASENEQVCAEYRFEISEGDYRWILSKAKKIWEFSYSDHAIRIIGIFADVTDQKKVECRLADLNIELESRVKERTRAFMNITDQLKISESKLKEILDAMPLGIAWKDSHLRYSGCNRRFLFDLAISSTNELVGKTDQELGWICDISEFKKSDLAALKGEFIALSSIEVNIKKETAYFRIFKAPFHYSNKVGEEGVLIVCENITDQKRVEDQNLYNLNLLETLLEASPDHISIVCYEHSKGVFLLANSALINWSGRSSIPVEGKSLVDIYGVELTNTLEAIDRKILEGNTENQFDLWMRNSLGKKRLFNFLKTAFYDRYGKIIGVLSVARDITEKRTTEMIHQTFYEYSTEPHVLLKGLSILYANRALAHALGLDTKEEVMNVNVSTFFEDADPLKIQTYLAHQAIAKEKGMQRFEWSYRHPERGLCTYEVTQIAVNYLDDVALMEVWHDIEDRVRQARELLDAKQVAERSAYNKNRFLSHVSYEIRTPMNSILGFSQVALRKSSDGTTKKYLKKINEASVSLLTILNDILDFSKLEAKALQICCEPVNIREFMTFIVTFFQDRAKIKGLGLFLDIDKEMPNVLTFDPIQVRKIITNLVSNAIKFTEIGEIEVLVQYLEGKLHISVMDSGIGIDQDQMQYLFEPYDQGNDPIASQYSGTCLNLVVSKQLAEKMNGQLLVYSQPGVGSQFVVQIPAEISQEDILHVDNDSQQLLDFTSAKILIAEDDLLNQELIKEVISEFGATALVVNNGQEVLKALLNEPFDLLFMDVQMPIMDGIKATEEIRALGQDIPIIAMTANVLDDDRKRCIDAGMNDYLSKPIHLDEVQAKLSKWLT